MKRRIAFLLVVFSMIQIIMSGCSMVPAVNTPEEVAVEYILDIEDLEAQYQLYPYDRKEYQLNILEKTEEEFFSMMGSQLFHEIHSWDEYFAAHNAEWKKNWGEIKATALESKKLEIEELSPFQSNCLWKAEHATDFDREDICDIREVKIEMSDERSGEERKEKEPIYILTVRIGQYWKVLCSEIR